MRDASGDPNCQHFTENGNAHEPCVVCGLFCVACCAPTAPTGQETGE